MRNSLIFALVLIFVQQSFAQKPKPVPLPSANVEAEWGPLKKSRTGGLDQLLGHDGEGGYFTFEYTKMPSLFDLNGESAICYYDKNFMLKKTIPFGHTDEKGVAFNDFYPGDEYSYVFTTKSYPKEKRSEYRVQTFDISLNPIDQPRVIAEMSAKANDRGSSWGISSNSNYFGSTLSSAGIRTMSSREQSKILIFKNYTFDHMFKKEDKNEKYELTMLNAADKLKEMWKINVEMPYESNLFEILDGCVDEEGNFYLIGVLFENPKKKVDAEGRPNYKYKLLKFNNSGKVFESEISAKDKFLTDLKLDISSNGNLVCTGFYSKDRKTTSVNGVYYMSIDADKGNIKKESYKEFELDMLTENMSEKKAKRLEKRAAKGKDINLYQFTFDALIPRSDGGAVIIAEQYYVYTTTTTTTSSTGAVTTRTTYHYRYNNILVINVTPEGEIEWAHKIPKLQHTQNDNGYYSSYALLNGGKDLFFIYNDNGRNTLDKAPKDYKAFIGPTKGAITVTATIDQNGKVDRRQLFNARNRDTVIRPKQSMQLSDNSILIQAIKRKKSQFVRLTYN